jgi:hypothetical protein
VPDEDVDDNASPSEPEDSSPSEPEDSEVPAEQPAPEPLADADIRAGMRTLDGRERKWGFIASGFVLALSLIYVPELLHTTYAAPTTKPIAGHCAHGFHLIGKLCDTIYHPSDYALQFSILIALGGAFLFAVWRSKRTLSIFLAMLAGLASTFVGGVVVLIVGLGYGGWLLARSWRLQRYGTTDSREMRERAAERAEAKRAARRAEKGSADTSRVLPRTSVQASKRYTPKAKPRRR